MATKITIDELVTKYIFEVDKKGAEAYEKTLDKASKTHKKETSKQSGVEKKARNDLAKFTEKSEERKLAAVKKGVSRTEGVIKKLTQSTERASKRNTRAAQKEAKISLAARSRAAALTTAGSAKAAAKQTQIAMRAERRQAAIVAKGARAQNRANQRAQRQVRQAHRRTTRVVQAEARKQRRAVAQAARSSRRGQGGGSDRGERMAKAKTGLTDISRAGALVTAALAGATAAIGGFVNAQSAALDEIAKASKQTGLGAEEYQRLAFAAERSGTSIAGIGTASKKLESQLLDVAAGGGKALTDALGQIGVSAEELQGKTFEAQLGIISDAMNQTATDTEKVGISAKIFGMRAGPDMIPLLNEGSEGLKKLGEAAGNVFTPAELAPAEEFQDRMTDVGTEIKQVAGRFALELMPAVESAVVAFREWIKENEPLITEQAPRIAEFFSNSAKLAMRLASGVTGLTKKIPALTTTLETLALAFVGVKLALIGPAGLVAAAALGGVAIGNMMNAFGADENLVQFLETITGANAELRKLNSLSGGVTKKRGGAEFAGGGGPIKTAQDVQEFSKGGKKFKIEKKQLLAVALGEQTSSVISQKEALNIFSQIDKTEDPGRIQRGLRVGKANAAKAEQQREKPRKGKARKATGLEAQIDSQVKQLASQAELRASAQALQEGKGSKEAFAIGREAAKQTESRVRGKFEESGELPIGIARDISQLARSPAVEESIGRVPPPVISVVNNVTNNTVSGNEFSTNVDATLTSGVGVADLEQMSARATIRLLNRELGNAVSNVDPQTRV